MGTHSEIHRYSMDELHRGMLFVLPLYTRYMRTHNRDACTL